MGKSTQTKLGYIVYDEGETREIIWIDDKNRERGGYALGLSGMGKSGFYQTIALQDIGKEYATIIFDPHGDLVNHLIAQFPNDETILKRVYLLDLTDEEYPFALNIFTCANPASSKERTRTRNRVLEVFKKLWPEVARSVLFDKIMPNVVETLIENQGMTIGDIPQLLHNAEYRKAKTRNLHNSVVRMFWQLEYKEKEAEVLDNRLRTFLIDPVIRNITCHPGGSINLRQAIEEKQIILVRLPTELDEYKQSAPIIGTMLLSLLVGATFSFDDTEWNKRPGYSLFVDEVENFITDDFDTIYNQARKYKVRLLIANQHLYQLPQTMQKAAIGADIVIAFKVDKDDARYISELFLDTTRQAVTGKIERNVLQHLSTHPRQEVRDFFENFISWRLDMIRLDGNILIPYKYDYCVRPSATPERDVALTKEELTLIERLLLRVQEIGRRDDPLIDHVLKRLNLRSGYYDEDEDIHRLYKREEAKTRTKQLQLLSLAFLGGEQFFSRFVQYYYIEKDEKGEKRYDGCERVPLERVRSDTNFWTWVSNSTIHKDKQYPQLREVTEHFMYLAQLAQGENAKEEATMIANDIADLFDEKQKEINETYNKLEEKVSEYTKWLAKIRAWETKFLAGIDAIIAEPIRTMRTLTESDIASVLINLPPRHALIKLSGEQYNDPSRRLHMKTLDAPQAMVRGEVLNERLKRIRDQTRMRYCRPIAEVEASFNTPPVQEKEPTVSPNSELPEEDRPARRKRLED